jgi:glyoxylase-like metal-dependent hydrolase (beta-lactamase superfamily II)
MHCGDIEIRYLDGGPFGLDGGAMFGVVPKVLWEKKSPPDEKNRIRLRANSLLVRASGKTMVIETGNGTKLDAKLKSIYKISDGDPLLDSLHKAGVEPKDIDLVINTHLHFDHCGGNTHFADTRAVPTFPRARYIVQKNELDHAFHPTERDKASYFRENYQPMIESQQWDIVDGPAQISPGIFLELIPGHNAHIQAVKLAGGGKTLVFVADLLPTRHHIPLPWIMAYDLYPLQSLETKRLWIPQIVEGGWIVVFGHDPDVAAATLHEHDEKIEVEPVDLNR